MFVSWLFQLHDDISNYVSYIELGLDKLFHLDINYVLKALNMVGKEGSELTSQKK